VTDDHVRDGRPEEGDDYAAFVRGLVRDLAGTSITRLELRHGDLRVELRREPGALAGAESLPIPQSVEEPGRPDGWYAVAAPLTGIFFTKPSPDEEPYVRVGSHVEADSVVGLIETMKMFNEVTADIAGTVQELVAENGALVEVGGPILYVEPGESVTGPPGGV